MIVIFARVASGSHSISRGIAGTAFGAHRRVAAVDGPVGAGDEARLVGEEERHDAGDLGGIADAPEQMERRRHPVGLLPVVARQLDHHLRPRPARRDAVDPDAVGREVHRHVACQLHDRGLADRVEPPAGLGHLGGDRCEVDDRGPAARLQVWMDCLRHRHRADEVDVERLEPVRARRGEALVQIGAGEVDEPVDATEPADRGLDESGDVSVARDVRPQEQHPLAELGREILAGALVDVGHGHEGTPPVQLADDSLTDQRRAARDGDHPAIQPSHQRPSRKPASKMSTAREITSTIALPRSSSHPERAACCLPPRLCELSRRSRRSGGVYRTFNRK